MSHTLIENTLRLGYLGEEKNMIIIITLLYIVSTAIRFLQNWLNIVTYNKLSNLYQVPK